MQKRISVARPDIRVVIVTLDNHLASAVERARLRLRGAMPGLHLAFHAAAEWDNDPAALEACKAASSKTNPTPTSPAACGWPTPVTAN